MSVKRWRNKTDFDQVVYLSGNRKRTVVPGGTILATEEEMVGLENVFELEGAVPARRGKATAEELKIEAERKKLAEEAKKLAEEAKKLAEERKKLEEERKRFEVEKAEKGGK